MDNNWLNELLLIADFIPGNPNDFDKFDVEKQVMDIKDLGFNSQHIEVNDVTVGEAGITFFKSKHAVEQRTDKLKDYRQSYKQHGGNDIVYFNVHWLTADLIDEHLEWFQKYYDGKLIPIAYGSGGYSCINSSFRDWAFNIIKDIGSYGVKGIFLDGPVFNGDGCYCEGCISRFEKKYGFKYNPENIKDIKVFKKVLDFKHESIAEFVKDSREALLSVNEHAMIYINSCPLGPNTDGRNNRMTIEYQDALLAEGGFLSGDLRSLPIWKPSASAKLLETQAGGKPAVVAIAGRHGSWNRYLLTAAETWLVYGQTVANGANVWYGIYDTNRNDRAMETVREINKLLSANSHYLAGTKSTAKIAIVWSAKNANFYQTTTEHWDFVKERSNLTNHLKSDSRRALNGWIEVLNGSHRLFDIIDDYYVENQDLSKYELVIFPNTACMSELEADKIKAYVEKGGNIITTYDTSFYDELGGQRENLLLKDVLGIEKVDGTKYYRCDHIEIEESSVTKGIEKPLIPAPNLHLTVVPQKDTKVFMNYREKQPSSYCDLPSKTDYPFMTLKEHGIGKAVMISGNIDATYENFRFPEFFDIMSNVIDILSNKDIIVDAKITTLNINIRKKDNNTMVHLINHTSYGGRPIRNIIPLKEVKIAIKSETKPKEVKMLRDYKVLPFSYDEKYITITVSEIKEYEILVIE
jgi:hypothetical protein